MVKDVLCSPVAHKSIPPKGEDLCSCASIDFSDEEVIERLHDAFSWVREWSTRENKREKERDEGEKEREKRDTERDRDKQGARKRKKGREKTKKERMK